MCWWKIEKNVLHKLSLSLHRSSGTEWKKGECREHYLCSPQIFSVQKKQWSLCNIFIHIIVEILPKFARIFPLGPRRTLGILVLLVVASIRRRIIFTLQSHCKISWVLFIFFLANFLRKDKSDGTALARNVRLFWHSLQPFFPFAFFSAAVPIFVVVRGVTTRWRACRALKRYWYLMFGSIWWTGNMSFWVEERQLTSCVRFLTTFCNFE